MPKVTISLVTWNGGQALQKCLQSVADQNFQDFELRVFDNGSADGTKEYLAQLDARKYQIAAITYAPKNIGFAAGHNAVFREARGEYILCLNQDVELNPDYLENIVVFLTGHPRVGSAAGVLLRSREGGGIIDSAGLQMFRSRRVADIGAGEVFDQEAARQPQRVFGVSAAAAVYRKAAPEDVADKRPDGTQEFFDEDFFSYKEDVDLAWRLLHRGWDAYVLPVFGNHMRGAKSDGASQFATMAGRVKKSSLANFHSQKNHLFVILKNDFVRNFLIDIVPILWYECKKLIFILVFEWKTIPSFFVFLRYIPAMLAKRRKIMSRTTLSAKDLRRWIR
ncbi:MAG TPA: glycosyltransferase family 2 protein [Patescibacteria group bacterium]|nr:glycosyltransferase family 2 protein [Patescibacteria group bacterium]